MLCLSGFELYSRWVPLLTAVRTRPVEFRENVRAFFPQGQSKLSVIMRCPGYSGVHKAAVCIPQLQSVRWLVLRWQQKQKNWKQECVLLCGAFRSAFFGSLIHSQTKRINYEFFCCVVIFQL